MSPHTHRNTPGTAPCAWSIDSDSRATHGSHSFSGFRFTRKNTHTSQRSSAILCTKTIYVTSRFVQGLVGASACLPNEMVEEAARRVGADEVSKVYGGCAGGDGVKELLDLRLIHIEGELPRQHAERGNEVGPVHVTRVGLATRRHTIPKGLAPRLGGVSRGAATGAGVRKRPKGARPRAREASPRVRRREREGGRADRRARGRAARRAAAGCGGPAWRCWWRHRRARRNRHPCRHCRPGRRVPARWASSYRPPPCPSPSPCPRSQGRAALQAGRRPHRRRRRRPHRRPRRHCRRPRRRCRRAPQPAPHEGRGWWWWCAAAGHGSGRGCWQRSGGRAARRQTRTPGCRGAGGSEGSALRTSAGCRPDSCHRGGSPSAMCAASWSAIGAAACSWRRARGTWCRDARAPGEAAGGWWVGGGRW